MKNLLFDNSRQWRVCLWAGVCKMAWGLWRILTCIVFGILSVFVYIGEQIEAFRKREFVASLIICSVICIILLCWMITFVNERSTRVFVEMQRDSLALRLDSAKQNSPSVFNRYQNHWDNDNK